MCSKDTSGRLWPAFLLLLLLTPAACAADPTAAQVKAILDDLAAQQYGRATARYQAEEERVLSPEAAPGWRRGLDHEDATVREWSVDALCRIGDPVDIPLVVAALDDPFRRVQEAAANGLVDFDPQAARAAFTERLANGEPLQRMIAAQGLADLRDTTAVPALIDQLGNAQLDDAVRGIIAQSLAALADPSAAAPLAELASDANVGLQLRRNASESLATLSGPEADAALSRLLETDDEYIRDLAARTLAARR